MTSYITDLLNEVKKENIQKLFVNSKFVIQGLQELNQVIGMTKLKKQITDDIKTFIVEKSYNHSEKNDTGYHTILTGPPGVGKTTAARIIGRIAIGVGFIKSRENFLKVKKVNNVTQLQDKIISSQRAEIQELNKKLQVCTDCIGQVTKVSQVCKRCIKELFNIKDRIPPETYNSLYNDLNKTSGILEKANIAITSVTLHKRTDYGGLQIKPQVEMPKAELDFPFYSFSKGDFVGQYLGHTPKIIAEAMSNATGGVAFFDEAYNIVGDSRSGGDMYGGEALTYINTYMDEHKDEIIVIFAGYKEDIEERLFSTQKGLKSRFRIKIDIEPYTPEELTKIFILRLEKLEWYLQESPELFKLIEENYEYFKGGYGRDMDTLAKNIKTIMYKLFYDKVIKGERITEEDRKIKDIRFVQEAIYMFKQNYIEVKKKNNDDLISRLMNLQHPEILRA